MKYYVSNPVLDAKISEIRQKIRLSMNGIVSDQMMQSGIIYKKNYGVSFPRLKEIAASYELNHDLAQRLWSLQIRETMILATLLEPVDSFSMKLAEKWACSFNQIEIIEQSCMNLFQNLPFANQLSAKWILSENKWKVIAGFILAARIYEKLNAGEVNILIQKAFEYSQTDDFHLYKSIALCLSRLCRKDKQTAASIVGGITQFSVSTSVSQQFIASEVKQEILFLGIL